ncbi:MAG: tetratricopeptide repeat protein [Fimbriimonas sp.]
MNELHQLALIQGFAGDAEGSRASLQLLSDHNPENLDLRYDLAMVQMMLGMYEEACGHLRYILRADPNHAKAREQNAYC